MNLLNPFRYIPELPEPDYGWDWESGVTKNASNEVSQWDSYTTPTLSVSQATSSQQPIENGDGILFDGDNNEELDNTSLPVGFEVKKPIFHCKFKYNETGDKFLFIARASNSNRFEVAYFDGTLQIWFNGTFSVVNYVTTLVTGTTYLVSCVPYLDGSDEKLAFYLDGVLVDNELNAFSTTTTPNYLAFGDYNDLDFSEGLFNIYYIKLTNNVDTYTLSEANQIALNEYNYG